ncbi:MAG TPA: type II toxin-antitoxin system VapC family toxin [Thermoanaerobaculia bacterium]|nr:type II toxin-antitoxin system VapC family toxin [Thermoanaerobaculia bacterium]
MSGFVLDTSVAIAWYLPETFSHEARRWQARLLAGDDRFVVPNLHYWEMANVLRTSVLRGRLTAPLARDIWALHLDAPLEIVEPEVGSVLARALELGATAYDTVFVELALSLNLQLLTAERVSQAWVARLGGRAVVLGAET